MGATRGAATGRAEEALGLVLRGGAPDVMLAVVIVVAEGETDIRAAVHPALCEGGPPDEELSRLLEKAVYDYMSRCPRVRQVSPDPGDAAPGGGN